MNKDEAKALAARIHVATGHRHRGGAVPYPPPTSYEHMLSLPDDYQHVVWLNKDDMHYVEAIVTSWEDWLEVEPSFRD